MRTLIEAELRDGVIYGDNLNGEYIYMPASEIGMFKAGASSQTRSVIMLNC